MKPNSHADSADSLRIRNQRHVIMSACGTPTVFLCTYNFQVRYTRTRTEMVCKGRTSNESYKNISDSVFRKKKPATAEGDEGK